MTRLCFISIRITSSFSVLLILNLLWKLALIDFYFLKSVIYLFSTKSTNLRQETDIYMCLFSTTNTWEMLLTSDFSPGRWPNLHVSLMMLRVYHWAAVADGSWTCWTQFVSCHRFWVVIRTVCSFRVVGHWATVLIPAEPNVPVVSVLKLRCVSTETGSPSGGISCSPASVHTHTHTHSRNTPPTWQKH